MDRLKVVFLVAQSAGPSSGLDRAVAMSAGWLEEAWAWGFDVDIWRAHLNALTWPEVSGVHSLHVSLSSAQHTSRECMMHG